MTTIHARQIQFAKMHIGKTTPSDDDDDDDDDEINGI